MDSTQQPLRFASKHEADGWLKETGNYGLVHPSTVSGFIIIQFHEGKTWAFTAPDNIQLLPEW